MHSVECVIIIHIKRHRDFAVTSLNFDSFDKLSAICKLYSYLTVKHKNELKLLVTTDFDIFSLFLTMDCHLLYNYIHLGDHSPRHIRKVREVRTGGHLE